MLVIEFNCRNQRLSRYTAGVIASNSYGYLKFKFNFKTNDWDDVSVKMANFSYKGRNYPILIDENNICTVPKEVIKVPGFSVSVFGGGITTNTVKVLVENSNVSYEDDESISTKYYNEIINKLTAQIDDLNESKADNIVLNEEDNTIQLSANGSPLGDKVERDADGVSGDGSGIYVPNVTEDNMLVFTLQESPGDERLEFDIDKSNDWNETDNTTSSNYVWEPME